MAGLTQKTAQERLKYVRAFNSTMLKIWEEKIILLGVIDTGMLLRSLRPDSTAYDSEATWAAFQLSFRTYGLFQNWGTGRDVPRGNPGDIGHTPRRRRRRWFDLKYFASTMNIRDFFADSLGRQFLGIVSDALSDRILREKITK